MRSYATLSQLNLKSTLKEVIPEKQALLIKLRNEYGMKELGDVKVEGGIGGMRCSCGKAQFSNKNEGIRFHGRTDNQGELLVYLLFF